jgi:hypothetical protein
LTIRPTNELLSTWLRADSPDTAEIEATHNLVTYLSTHLFSDYEPSQFDLFDDRLDNWLGNVDSNEDKKTLYLALKLVFFVGRREFEALCRAAFHGPVTRWLLDSANIQFNDSEASVKWAAAVDETWFCPITDSMRINAFLKVNNLDGKGLRPDWRSLAKFGDQGKIKEYIEQHQIKRIVLLEDFVGTGIQMSRALSFAAELDPNIPVLGCPLIICPDGLTRGSEIAINHANLSFAHVMSLPTTSFIKFAPQAPENSQFPPLRKLIAETASKLSTKAGQTTHGFGGSGAFVVLYSNCPDNTLPIIHESSDEWRPLFPRIRRA